MFDKYFEQKFNENKSLMVKENSVLSEKISILVILSSLSFCIDKITIGSSLIF